MGLTKPIEQDLLNFQGTFMYPKDIIRGAYNMEYVTGVSKKETVVISEILSGDFEGKQV